MATSLEFSRTHKICVLIITFLEYLLFSGVIYGWADLVYVLKLEGVFYNSCELNTTVNVNETLQNKNNSCTIQDNRFDLAFTIASFNKAIAAFLTGVLLDSAGLRITRIASVCFILIGGIFLALCNSENSYYIFPGALLTGLGGSAIRYANFQIANLFPNYKATIMSIYNGAFCGSPAILLLLKYCYEQGVSYSTFFYTWTGISSTMLLTTFFLLPKMNISADEEVNLHKKENDKSINRDDETQPLISSKNASTNNMRRSIFSLSYILHLICNGILALGIIIFIGTFNWWITMVTKNQDKVSALSTLYGFSQLPMIIVSPFIGLLMDSAVRKAQAEEDPVLRKKKLQRAGFYALLISSAVITLMSTCRLFSNVTAIYLSLVFYVISRPVINSICPAYIRIRFPQEQFNKLVSIFGVLTCISSVLQYPLFLWMQNDFVTCSSFLVGICVLTFINPFHLLFLKQTDV